MMKWFGSFWNVLYQTKLVKHLDSHFVLHVLGVKTYRVTRLPNFAINNEKNLIKTCCRVSRKCYSSNNVCGRNWLWEWKLLHCGSKSWRHWNYRQWLLPASDSVSIDSFSIICFKLRNVNFLDGWVDMMEICPGGCCKKCCVMLG